MHLFIDTNILLSFYHYTGDDLEELAKLAVLLEQRKIQLYVPEQLKAEFGRNREVKIADSLRKLKEQRLSLQFPAICKDYEMYARLRELQTAYEADHTLLLNKLVEDISGFDLKADKVITRLLSQGKKIPSDEKLIRKARDRFDLGNPPGKNDSLGDAVNWLALMAAVPSACDLHFISDDKDYCSPLDEEKFSGYLAKEWQIQKQGEIVFYKRISSFFKQHFPHIKLAEELEKNLAIIDLEESGSFASTHSIVGRLQWFSKFTPTQINDIVSAALANSQVNLIISDRDVHSFLAQVVHGNEAVIEPGNWLRINTLLAQAPEYDDLEDDIPF